MGDGGRTAGQDGRARVGARSGPAVAVGRQSQPGAVGAVGSTLGGWSSCTSYLCGPGDLDLSLLECRPWVRGWWGIVFPTSFSSNSCSPGRSGSAVNDGQVTENKDEAGGQACVAPQAGAQQTWGTAGI